MSADNHTEVLPEAIEFLRSRVADGAAEYGGPLVTHDGRDTPLDAVEEAGDLFLYVFKDYMERDEKEDELIRLRSDLEEARRDLEDYEDALAESECIDAERTEENARLRGQLDEAHLDYEGAMIDLERARSENAELREHILTQASVISEYQTRLDELRRLDREERMRELSSVPDLTGGLDWTGVE